MINTRASFSESLLFGLIALIKFKGILKDFIFLISRLGSGVLFPQKHTVGSN